MSSTPNGSLARAIASGILSGTFLGLFFKIMEQWTGVKVYTLLLNIDYIPYLNRIKFPELVEFAFHVLISILLSLILVIYFNRKKLPRPTLVLTITLVGIVVGMLLYPTTILSERTPEFTDLKAIFFWLSGHVLYGLSLGFLLAYLRPKEG